MSTAERISLTDWLDSHAASATVIAASDPVPVLHDRNLIAVGDSADDIRAVVLEWERIQSADRDVGFVALSTEDHPASGPDPEGVTMHATDRIVRGAIPGAVVGALAIAAVVALIVGWSPVVLAALAGGAAFGSVAGAVLSFTAGTGWGSAYEESFVPPRQADVMVATIHADEPSVIAEAARTVADTPGIQLIRVDGSGDVVDRDRASGTTRIDERD